MNELKKQYQKMQLIKNNNKYLRYFTGQEMYFLNENDYLIKSIKNNVVVLKFDKITKNYNLKDLKQRIKAYYIDIENIKEY